MSSIHPSRKQVCNEYAAPPTASLVYERYIERPGKQSSTERFPEGQRYNPVYNSREIAPELTIQTYGLS